MMDQDPRSIKTRLSEDHGITLRKCPRWTDRRRLVEDKTATVIGCATSHGANAYLGSGQIEPCKCGHGADADRYE
ncbi:hypothetical protein [Roseibium alexandrii]|uniref:hypothetical protein n=1 Tax=Roseibium alexandrii TaxID=388408 RepID=UPI0037529287